MHSYLRRFFTLAALGALALTAGLGCAEPTRSPEPQASDEVTEEADALTAAGTGVAPTSVTVTNSSQSSAFANLVLGQPPATPPSGCSSLGEQIQDLDDARLAFTSSVATKTVSFTLPTAAKDKGFYKMDAGETITYLPTTFACSSGICSPAVTFNFFFTTFKYDFAANNGCSNATFPNATNLAEASINFGINGSQGSTCANADDTDVSAVNGVNAELEISTQDQQGNAQPGWPQSTSLATNGALGTNANKPGVFGWAATNCNGPNANAGFPNPTAQCAAPTDAPKAPDSGTCTTPGGTTYAPIVAPDGTEYCDERSDSGTCNNQRAGGVTGGTVAISFIKAI